ncbi:hypothetical protein LPJ81_003327 [Coemansia sp. IMI 209127]|nr:hypothetical protein LPJ81_003327 [Coemansia sp. IMI 209127]
MLDDTRLEAGESAVKPHVLCPESDPEDISMALDPDYLGEWSLSSLEDLQVGTPPAQPTPGAPPQMQPKAAGVVSAADTGIAPMDAVPEPAISQHSISALVISDDSDLDRQLEAFDIDDQDIMILSDDDNDNAGAGEHHSPRKLSRSAVLTKSPVQQQQQPRQKKERKLRLPPKQARNMFIDAEAGVGDSDDECETGVGKRARRGVDVSEDESDGEDLNQDLSSFIVDDDHVEFTSPDGLGRSANGSGALSNGHNETPTRNSSDIYRRSLNESPITPMSEIMRQLAEREKARRWVSDTPTRDRSHPAGRNALDLRPSKAYGPDSDADDDVVASSETEEDFARSSSDFDNVEDMFSQAG